MTTPHVKSLTTKFAPPILASFRAWIQLKGSLKESSDISPMKLPIPAVGLLLPNINVNIRVDKGITYLEDVIEGTQIKSFKQIKIEHNLPLSEHYTFMQVANLWKNTPQLLTSLPGKVLRYYQDTSVSAKGISTIYTCLQDKSICDKSQSFLA